MFGAAATHCDRKGEEEKEEESREEGKMSIERKRRR